MKKHIFIIEHLEPKLWKWCFYEYKNISGIVGKKNLWITNLTSEKDRKKLSKYCRTFSVSVKNMKLKNICVLDPESKKTLTPRDAGFDYFIFGGILGDYPPKKRTKKELTKFISGMSRNIGKKQMSTDNAVYTVNEILKGKKLNNLKFKNKIEIKINETESVILPYNYNIVNGKPLVSDDVIGYLKRKKGL